MKIITTSINKPPRMVLYGEHKVGKSTFASKALKPIFIQTEDGLDSLNVQAFEKAKSYNDVLDAIRFLIKEPHEYKTLVLDSLDWAETLIWQKVCVDNNVAQIGDVPYGGGYKLALTMWDKLIEGLDILNIKKQMMIILLAHSKISKFEDPTNPNYDRYSLDLHDKAGSMILEWSDIIGFANDQVIVKEAKEGFKTSVKGKETGLRMLYLNKKAGYVAGNRFSLPDMQLDFKTFWEALKPNVKKAEVIKEMKLASKVEVINMEKNI